MALLALAAPPNHPLIALAGTSGVSSVGVASAKRLSEYRFGSWLGEKVRPREVTSLARTEEGGEESPRALGLWSPVLTLPAALR